MRRAYVILDTLTGNIGSVYGTKMPAIYGMKSTATRIKNKRYGTRDRFIVCEARIQIIGGEVAPT